MIKKDEMETNDTTNTGHLRGRKGVTKRIQVNFYLPTGDHWLQNDLPCACWTVWK